MPARTHACTYTHTHQTFILNSIYVLLVISLWQSPLTIKQPLSATHMHAPAHTCTHTHAHTHTHTHTICCQLSCSEKAAVILKLHLFHFPHYYMHWHHNSCKHASELCILCWNVWLFNSPSIVKSYCPNTLQNISWFKIIISSAKFYSWLNIYHNTVGNSTHFIF